MRPVTATMLPIPTDHGDLPGAAERMAQVLAEIAAITGLTPLDLRLERDFHVDLGFRLWN